MLTYFLEYLRHTTIYSDTNYGQIWILISAVQRDFSNCSPPLISASINSPTGRTYLIKESLQKRDPPVEQQPFRRTIYAIWRGICYCNFMACNERNASIWKADSGNEGNYRLNIVAISSPLEYPVMHRT